MVDTKTSDLSGVILQELYRNLSLRCMPMINNIDENRPFHSSLLFPRTIVTPQKSRRAVRRSDDASSSLLLSLVHVLDKVRFLVRTTSDTKHRRTELAEAVRCALHYSSMVIGGLVDGSVRKSESVLLYVCVLKS